MADHDAHPRPERAREYTHTVSMTTRDKCLFSTAYPVVFAVEHGKAVEVTPIDPTSGGATSAWVVAADTPGQAYVSVTPVEPHEDYVPAMVLCEVGYRKTDLLIGTVEPK